MKSSLYTTAITTRSRYSLLCLLVSVTGPLHMINSFSPNSQPHLRDSNHVSFFHFARVSSNCNGFAQINYSQENFKSPSPVVVTTQLRMAKDSNRARTEKNLEEMMGDDWRLFRARLVVQEQTESKWTNEDSNNNSQGSKRNNLSSPITHQSQSSQNSHSSLNEDHEDKKSHIVSAFTGAIASIFSSKDGQHRIRNSENNNNQHHKNQEDSTLNGQKITIGSKGVSYGKCEDPFASEAEIVATTQQISAAIQLDRHRWAHPIPHIEPGCVLIANEKLGGVFHQTVLLIIDHHEAMGSTGIVINRPLNGNLLKIASETASNVDLSLKLAFNCAGVTYGGPVMQEDYSILHGYGEVEGSKKVAPGVFVGGSRELMDEVRKNSFDPHEVLFVKGHAAWVPSQLSREIVKGVWYTASVSPDHILRYACAPKDIDDNDNLWADLLTCMGGKYKEIAEQYSAERGDRRVSP